MDVIHKKYSFVGALRPFSFSVALIACGVGIAAAWPSVHSSYAEIFLILIGGLLLQAGVNLINDYSDIQQVSGLSSIQKNNIRRHFQVGLTCFGFATVIGFWFVFQVGWPFLLLAMLGLAGALGYTLPPINYKGRGLGVVIVFWMMGVLMVCGSYLLVTNQLNLEIFLLSLPVSCLVSLLLLSNELRDIEADQARQIQTLSVRLGTRRAQRLFNGLLVVTYCLTILIAVWVGDVWFLLPLLSLMVAKKLVRLMYGSPQERVALPPLAGKLLLLYGLLFIVSLIMRA